MSFFLGRMADKVPAHDSPDRPFFQIGADAAVEAHEPASRFHLWSEQFDRDLDDIFAVQDEITPYIITSMS